MPQHPQKRILRVDEIDEHFLRFRLTDEQKAKAGGQPITFRKSTQPKNGYSQLFSRAEYNKINPKTGRSRATPAATKLVGIIWNDDPEWVYETDARRSPVAERRQKAQDQAIWPRITLSQDVPLAAFVTVALTSAKQGLTDAGTIARLLNTRLASLAAQDGTQPLPPVSENTICRLMTLLTPHALYQSQVHFPNSDKRHCQLLDIDSSLASSVCTAVAVDEGSDNNTIADLNNWNMASGTVTATGKNATAAVAQAIVEYGAFYLFELRNSALANAVRAQFSDCPDEVTVMAAGGLPQDLLQPWPGLAQGCLMRVRRPKGATSAYFISCHPAREMQSHTAWLTHCARALMTLQECRSAVSVFWPTELIGSKYPAYLRTQCTLRRWITELNAHGYAEYLLDRPDLRKTLEKIIDLEYARILKDHDEFNIK